MKPERNTHDTAFPGAAILGDRRRHRRGCRSHGCCGHTGRRDTQHRDTDFDDHHSHHHAAPDIDREPDIDRYPDIDRDPDGKSSDVSRRHGEPDAHSIGKDRFEAEPHRVRRAGADPDKAGGIHRGPLGRETLHGVEQLQHAGL